MTHSNTTLHWILAQFLKDSLEFLSKDPRAKGMKRMDWIDQWIEKEYPKTLVWVKKSQGNTCKSSSSPEEAERPQKP